jgi:hypothetical protein
VETGDRAVLAFRRSDGPNQVLCVFNLTDQPRPAGIVPTAGMRDLLSCDGDAYPAESMIHLGAFQALWLIESGD